MQIGHDIGVPGNPAEVTFLAAGSVGLNGNPYMEPAHPDSIMILAAGDIKINGDPSGGHDTMEGLIYAGSQCVINGKPVIYGQLVCRDNPDPPGSLQITDNSEIDGEFKLTFQCGGILGDTDPNLIPGRMWSHIW